MCPHPAVSSAAFLIADPTRATMLMALADGRAQPAGELAHAAGVTAQTASSHLAKLLAGGLLLVETQGRHRYYRLAGSHVALALENLASIAPISSISPISSIVQGGAVRRMPRSRQARDLQFARCCYDHLAGGLGVAVTQALQDRGFISAAADKQFEVTHDGMGWFSAMGLDMAAMKPTRRGLARQCLDWTERRHHLAGPLGVAFMTQLCAKGWLRRLINSRAVQVTPKGWAGLKEELGVDERSIEKAA